MQYSYFPPVLPQRIQRWARGCLGPWCGYCTQSTGTAPVHTHIQAASGATYSHWHWSYWSLEWWSFCAKMKDWARLRLHLPPPQHPLMSAWFCIGKQNKQWRKYTVMVILKATYIYKKTIQQNLNKRLNHCVLLFTSLLYAGFLLHLGNRLGNSNTVMIRWSVSWAFEVELSLGGVKFDLCVILTWSETSWISSWWWTLETPSSSADAGESLSGTSASQSQHNSLHLYKKKKKKKRGQRQEATDDNVHLLCLPQLLTRELVAVTMRTQQFL